MREGLGVTPPWDAPKPTDIVMRQSTIESMTLCPARVGYSTHPDFDPTPSEAMSFGSLMHRMIELDLTNDPVTIAFESVKGIVAVLKDVVASDGYELRDLTNPFHADQIAMEAREAYHAWRAWWKKERTTHHIQAIEDLVVRPLGMLNEEVAVWVQGTPDVVYLHSIDDWKTAKRGWDGGKATVRIQSAFYTWLEEERFVEAIDGDGVPFTYVVYDRSKQKWTTHTVVVTRESIDAALITAWEWAKQIHHGVYPPTPSAPAGRPGRGWWCSATYCGAWNVCEYKQLVQDNQLVQIRSSRWAA